jgi:hypothetical protein
MSSTAADGNSNSSQTSLKLRSGKRSVHTHKQVPERRPLEIFRATVSKVMAMKRSTMILAAISGGVLLWRCSTVLCERYTINGWLPDSEVDYPPGLCDRDCGVSSKFLHMRNAEFVGWCASPRSKRQPWIKFRWIKYNRRQLGYYTALSFKHGTFHCLWNPASLLMASHNLTI